MAADGYPIETVRIAQFADPRHVVPYAFPIGPSRTWHHRYAQQVEIGHYGQLCLWYPYDPARLVWNWSRGLVGFVAIAQRHLWFEEYYRRTGFWPVEDAPHGHRADNRPHPVRHRAARTGSFAA